MFKNFRGALLFRQTLRIVLLIAQEGGLHELVF